MGASASSEPDEKPITDLQKSLQELATPTTSIWSEETAQRLQELVDQVFDTNVQSLLGLQFSFTIADPFLRDCPLIGCSMGFSKLVGYDLNDIVGNNCRFLIDSVPGDELDKEVRVRSRAFCEAVRRGEQWTPPSDYPYSPGVPCDEIVCVQRNRRKDGSLFNNMFYMKVFDLSSEMGEEKPYIVGLQSDLKGGKDDQQLISQNLQLLSARMEILKQELASLFFMQCSMSRQFTPERCHSLSRERGPSDEDDREGSKKMKSNEDRYELL